MYRNLEAELARENITKTELAKKMGLNLGTLSSKLNGRYKLTLPEAMKIKRILNNKLSLDYLFDTNLEERS